MANIFKNYPEIMTAEEVAEVLRLDVNEVLTMLETEKLKGIKIGATWRILKTNLLILLELLPSKEKPLNFDGRKIGVLVKQRMKELLENNRIPLDEINRLKEVEYSKKVFGLQFPMIIEYKTDCDTSQTAVNGHSRYWKTLFQGKYYITNHWYKEQRLRFESWANNF